MNKKNIVDPIEKKDNKIKLEINNINNNIIDIVDDLDDEFNIVEKNILKTYNKSNSFIINRYYENDIVKYIEKKYDVIIEKKYNNYEINNKTFYDVELNIVDPIYKDIYINKIQLKNIFKDQINNIDKIFKCNIKNINELIEIDIDIIFNKHDNNYINHYSNENKINSYDLLRLFDLIVDDVNNYNHDLKYDDEFNYDDEKIDVDDILKLFNDVVNELNKFSYFNSNKLFKINLFNMNYLMINNYYYNDEILYELLYNDLIECINDDLLNLFDIDIYNDINDLLFIENNYIDNIINDELYDLKYNIDIDKNYNFNNYGLEINIDSILKMNEKINDLKKLIYDPLKIDELFENYNNSYDDDELIYLIFDNEYELFYSNELYYNNCYYEFDNIKFYSLYDLKNYMLNKLKHYNLNNSFKFDDELYNIY